MSDLLWILLLMFLGFAMGYAVRRYHELRPKSIEIVVTMDEAIDQHEQLSDPLGKGGLISDE